MTKLTKLRQMANHLYDIAEDGGNDLDKTAAEVEAEMQVYLQSALGPLLEKAQAVEGRNRQRKRGKHERSGSA